MKSSYFEHLYTSFWVSTGSKNPPVIFGNKLMFSGVWKMNRFKSLEALPVT